MPPAVTIRPSPAMTSVDAPTTNSGSTPAIVPGLPALPTPTMWPSLMPISRLDDAPVIDDQGVGDDQIERAVALAWRGALPHAIADDLAAAKLDFVTVDGEILLDFDDQLGVGQANPVAYGRAVHLGIDAPLDR